MFLLSFQSENSTACMLCPPGEYCQGSGNSEPTGLCDAGWFCTGGAYEAQPIVLGKMFFKQTSAVPVECTALGIRVTLV